ncbi:regulatory protein RecX [Flavobacterium gelidilacus]|uniref:regulatory protein RecX n=1 Tax=Flavobacterium gelidilacus TaxID=206041 RepID=UPI0006883DB6|nr:regulatory protein RecX [Flavobacterium gelidilacus]
MKNTRLNTFSIVEVRNKLEYYCAYQDRCHQEVYQKMFSFSINTYEKEELMVYLIENNFLNEERFAQSFTRGKHNYKKWGKVRIVNELKARNISSTIIKIALKEINDSLYLETFEELANKHWESITESNFMKKRKKFCDYFLRKGWENELIYEKVRELEKL